MATLDRMTLVKDLLVKEIGDILEADLDFLSKLSLMELGILARSMEKWMGCDENQNGIDSFLLN